MKAKTLIAIMCCEHRQGYADSQRDTWIKDIPVGLDYRIFYGKDLQDKREPEADELFLDCDDSYRGLPDKVQQMCRWALWNDYEFIFKCDDDVYVRPDRLLKSGYQKHDYIGNYQPGAGYAFGHAYWLSCTAAKVIAEATQPVERAEDRWVGHTLSENRYTCHHDPRYILTLRYPRPGDKATEMPTIYNDLISAAEFPGDMLTPHKAWNDSVKEFEETMEGIRV